ncbi:MAG: HAD family hydrolase [Leptospira sp.]|jgi:phosphoglycolate phosphatase|nr:HAD family hydrolase [Leptospira sp.]
MMSIRVLAFDIDGTIFSSESIISQVYAEAVSEYAALRGLTIPIPGHEDIMKEIGKPVKTIFANLLPMMPPKERDKISDRVLSLLVENIQAGKGHYYEEIENTIRDLHSKGFKLVACSNGRSAYIEAILKYLNVLSLFCPLVVLDEKNRLEKGDILAHYIKEMNIPAESILMIGDRHSDWEASRKTGSPFAFCDYGHADPGEIPNYEFILKNPEDLKKILL